MDCFLPPDLQAHKPSIDRHENEEFMLIDDDEKRETNESAQEASSAKDDKEETAFGYHDDVALDREETQILFCSRTHSQLAQVKLISIGNAFGTLCEGMLNANAGVGGVAQGQISSPSREGSDSWRKEAAVRQPRCAKIEECTQDE